jgi:hypothetical protein
VWVREETADLIIQGETVDAALRAEINDTVWVPGHRPGIPAHEAVITLPLRMVPILKEACGVAERSGLC